MGLLITKIMIDVVMAVLLIGTIWYCKRLDTRIKILQDSKSELAKMIKRFDDSTEKAALCIGEIHKVSQRVHENMSHHMDKANYIANDLSFMVERGRKVAGMSESELDDAADNIARKSTRKPITEPEQPADSSEKRAASRSGASTPIQGGRRASDLAIEDQSIKEDNKKIEKMLNALSQNKDESAADTSSAQTTEILTPDEVAQEKPGNVKLRSKAEQELYEALRSSGGKPTSENV